MTSNPFGNYGDPWAYLDGVLSEGCFDALCGPADASPWPVLGAAGDAGHCGVVGRAASVDDIRSQLPAVQLSLLGDVVAWGPVTDAFLVDLRRRRRELQGATRGSIRNHVMALTRLGLISTTRTGDRGTVARFALPAGFELLGMGWAGPPAVAGTALQAHLKVLHLVSRWPRGSDRFPRLEVETWDGGRDPLTGRPLVHRVSGLTEESATWIPAAYGRRGDSSAAVMVLDERPAMNLVNDLRIVLEASDLAWISIVATDSGRQFSVQERLDGDSILATRCRVHSAQE